MGWKVWFGASLPVCAMRWREVAEIFEEIWGNNSAKLYVFVAWWVGVVVTHPGAPGADVHCKLKVVPTFPHANKPPNCTNVNFTEKPINIEHIKQLNPTDIPVHSSKLPNKHRTYLSRIITPPSILQSALSSDVAMTSLKTLQKQLFTPIPTS